MPKSDEQAARWMAQAANAGHLPAEIEYAIMLFNGTGVAADEAAAAQLFLRAAGKGNPIAQNRIARLYQSGRGIPPDSIEAAAWHLAARAKGLDDPAWSSSSTAEPGTAGPRRPPRRQPDRGRGLDGAVTGEQGTGRVSRSPAASARRAPEPGPLSEPDPVKPGSHCCAERRERGYR